MFSSTTLLVCIVDLMCSVDHMCLLACNVCGRITDVAFPRCGILHLTVCGSTSGPAWYPSCPVISGKLPSSGLLHYLWFISVCVGHLSAVFTPSRHCFYSTESIFYFFAACPIYPAKVSHYYRPTSVDTASVHIVKGITQNIHKRRWRHLLRSLSCGGLLVYNEDSGAVRWITNYCVASWSVVLLCIVFPDLFTQIWSAEVSGWTILQQQYYSYFYSITAVFDRCSIFY